MPNPSQPDSQSLPVETPDTLGISETAGASETPQAPETPALSGSPASTDGVNRAYDAIPPVPYAGEPSVEGEQSGELVAVEGRQVEEAQPSSGGGGHRFLASAGLIAIGQLLGSILGFVRITILNVLFHGAASGAFAIALRPVQQISDLVIQGSVGGALIPTFVDYGDQEKRKELSHVFSTVVNLVLIVMSVAFAGIWIAAPFFVPLLVSKTGSSGATDTQLIVSLVRIIGVSLFGLGLFAATSALLYALKQVVFPAFATGIYHVAIVVCGIGALFLASRQLGVSLGTLTDANVTTQAAIQGQTLGAQGLALGAAIGAASEFLILIPGLRRVGVRWRPVLDLRHPGVRQILRLYVPLLAGLLLSIAQQVLDTTLWGHSPGGWQDNTTALLTGTTLVQFPVGLVTAALSFAVLPPLTAAASRGDLDDFKRTLVLGIRLGLLLMVPAMVGLIALRMPILTLLFEHGRCGSGCTVRNALAVQNYAYELPFIALDQLLIAAFYARKNTLTPNIVGVVSIGFYLLVALPFGLTIGLPALAFADTAKNTSHALILLVLLTLAIGNLGMRNLLSGVARIVVAAAAMGVVCVVAATVLPAQLPGLFGLAHTPGRALTFLVAGASGTAVYFGLVTLLRVEEVRLVSGIVRKRLGERR